MIICGPIHVIYGVGLHAGYACNYYVCHLSGAQKHEVLGVGCCDAGQRVETVPAGQMNQFLSLSAVDASR